jgi:hypothetical protein
MPLETIFQVGRRVVSIDFPFQIVPQVFKEGNFLKNGSFRIFGGEPGINDGALWVIETDLPDYGGCNLAADVGIHNITPLFLVK